MLNIPTAIENLDKIRESEPEKITYTYQKLFASPEGELILIDLMDKFFEFKPTSNSNEAGAQGVIIYIKNRILGVTEPKQRPEPTGDHNE